MPKTSFRPWQYAWCGSCNGLLGRDSLSEEWHHRGTDCGNTTPVRLDTDKSNLTLSVESVDDIGKSNQRESDYWRRVGGHDELSALGEE